MVYYKVVFDDRKPTKDNFHPVVIRITNNRKSTSFTTGVRVQKEHCNESNQSLKKEHPNCLELNRKISEFYLKVQKAVLQMETEDSFSFDELKSHLTNGGKPKLSGKSIAFNDYGITLVNELISINKAGNAIIYKTAVNRLVSYSQLKKIRFTDITYQFIDGFKRQLIKDGVKQNTISNYFRTIRAIYNKGIKAKLVDRRTILF